MNTKAWVQETVGLDRAELREMGFNDHWERRHGTTHEFQEIVAIFLADDLEVLNVYNEAFQKLAMDRAMR